MGEATMNPPKGVPPKELDGLFQGPLEEFTAARNELAKSLRSDGEGEAADWVKGLSKPSRAAWLVNQLAVRKSDEITDLLGTGRVLQAAQEEMLAGSTDRDKLREAAHREQQIIDSLLRTAEAIGGDHGVGAQILTRVGETLKAASSDRDVALAIAAARLTKEQRAAGVGLVGPATPAKPKGKGAKAKDREAKDRRERQQQAKHRKEAERKLATAERNLERERDKLERARGTVEQAERRVHEAELDANSARRALEEI
jgi:hypothetical protein